MSDAPGVKEVDGAHEGPIKTPKQLIIAVFFAFVIPVVVILLLALYVESQNRPAAGSDNLSDRAVRERTAPVGTVQVQEASQAAAATPDASSAPASGSAEASAPAGGADPAAMAAAASQVAAAKAASAPAEGGAATVAAAGGPAPALYSSVCTACHSSGAAGAPKLGDKAAWAPRLAQGIDGLTASAIKGKGAMPPRGGSQASDADIHAVVAYMVGAVK